MKNSALFSIKTFVLIGLLLSVVIPFFIAQRYIKNENEKKLYSTFEETREELTSNIANVMVHPLKTFTPSEASSALEIIKQDSRIVKIKIYDEISQTTFISIYIPEREKGSVYKNHQTIYCAQNENIGWVEITFSDAHIQEQLVGLNQAIEKILTSVFIILLVVMYSLLHFKIFSPLDRLFHQARDFQKNNLTNRYVWKGKDELSIVGQSFEEARLSILNLVQELSAKNKELKKLYVTDKLTNLYNRHKLDMALDHEEYRAKRHNQNFGIIIIDLDDFKRVNDVYGHLVGDKVLIATAAILRNNIRKSDILGRWGGEEFLVIVPQTSREDLLELSKKLKEFICNYDFKLSYNITASFGVSLYEQSLITLLKNADDALYESKKQGKNKITFY